MKINKRSWHYRWSNFFTNQNAYNANLCSYFWKLMFSIFFPLVCVFVIGVGIIMFLIALFTEPTFLNALLMVLSVIGCIFLPPIAINQYRKRSKCAGYRVYGEEVIVEFVMAKKKKVCPLIEFYYS